MVRLVAMSLVVVAAACGSRAPTDPFTADMKMICNAGGHVGSDQATVLAMPEIASKVRTAEAARLVVAAMRTPD